MNIDWHMSIARISPKFIKVRTEVICIALLIPLKFTGSNSFYNFKKENDGKED